jgi:hypothetical protein
MIQQITSNHFNDVNGNPAGGTTFGPGLCIGWQHGPLGRGDDRLAPNGCFVETVINAAIDRLMYYQQTRFESGYNADAIVHLERALSRLQDRTADREKRDVEGTHAE